MAPPVAIVLILSLSFTTVSSCLEFKPVTEDVSLKAIYRLQTFVNKEPHSLSEIHEHYQHNLASSNIWIRRHVDSFDSSPVKRFLYNGELKRDVEMVGDHDPGQIYLYQSGTDPTGTSRRVKRVKSVHLYGDKTEGSSTESNSLDFVMYKLYKEHAKKFSLNLDLFLEKSCRDKMDGKLHYVRGLTRLLEMIECRRTDFRLNSALTSANDLTRGIQKTVYSVENLPSIPDNTNSILPRFLNVTISVEKRKTTTEQVLPARSIPLSLSLEFGYNQDQDPVQVLMIINVFQFETVPLNEHLMAWESLYLLPKASGLDDMLTAEYVPRRHKQHSPQLPQPQHGRDFPRSFSFTASMTGSHLKIGQDPIELSVVYDAKTRVLARQLSLIDRGQVVGDTYQRHVSRLVYDYPSKYKFHIKHQNNDYFYSDQQQEQQNEKDYYWRQCASNLIVDSELIKLETGGSRVFNLDKAVYLGRERIRGIICNVYELRSYGLPIWMGWEDFENYYWIKSDMHATVYEAANYVLNKNYEQEEPIDDFITSNGNGKIVRLQINIVPHDSSTQQGDIMSYTLDMHHFEWEISSNLAGLMDIGQDCFLASSNVRHLDMSIALEPLKANMNWSKFSFRLAHNALRRQQTVSKLLDQKPFHISPIQQIDLRTSIAPGNLLEAQLAVYEQPQNQLRFRYLGYADDQTVGSAQFSSWHQGATSISLQECNWRAAHTLEAEAYTSTSRGPAIEQRRLLMYCAHSFHCVLDLDSNWMQAGGKLKSVEGLFKYPVSSDHPRRCALVELWMDPMTGSPHFSGAGATRPLEWLLKVEAELMDSQEVVELEVDDEEDIDPLTLKVSKLVMSHIVQPDGRTSGGLGGPLKGLGYQDSSSNCSNQVEVKVSSTAQCSHQCLMSAHCRSYSLCHHHGHLDCLLTRVNWTEPVKVEQLRSLVHVPMGSSGRASKIDVTLEDGSSETLTLQRSPLCSMHERKHLELFKFRNSSLVLMAPAVQLLKVPSPDHCARYCLHRVQMMLALNKGSPEEEEEEDTCLVFRYSRSLNLCELLPGRALSLEWRESIGGESADLSWSKKLPRFDEMETYELQYELLFEPKPNLRLVLEGRGLEAREDVEAAEAQQQEQEESSWRWQMTVARACSAQMCARYCLMNRNCRSFDLLAPASAGLSARQLASSAGSCHLGELCVLNGLALDDIRNPNRPQQQHGFALKRLEPVGVEANRWWHYEPSQLAQFAAFAGRRQRRHASGGQLVASAAGNHGGRAQTTGGIFISASAGAGVGAMAAGSQRHEHVKSAATAGADDVTRRRVWWALVAAIGMLIIHLTSSTN